MNSLTALKSLASAQPCSNPGIVRLSSTLGDVLCLDDFEVKARRRLPRPIFGYIAGAAENNHSLDDNRAVFDEYGFATMRYLPTAAISCWHVLCNRSALHLS